MSLKIFHELLRPEIVRTWKTSLSCNAFSGWQRSDNNCKKMNSDITECTQYLINNIIPNFVQMIIEKKRKIYFESQLISYIHEFGINIRYSVNLVLISLFSYSLILSIILLLQNALSWFVSSLDFLLLYYHYYLMNL
jgi:hypothetical protein